MGTSVKLRSELVETARLEAKAMDRSLAEQIGYWARLGRALEHQPGVSVERVRRALAATLPLDELNREERAAYMAGLEDLTFHPKGVPGIQKAEQKAGVPFVYLGDHGEVIEVAPDGAERVIEDVEHYGRDAESTD